LKDVRDRDYSLFSQLLDLFERFSHVLAVIQDPKLGWKCVECSTLLFLCELLLS
jgi:hypothetical protein